MRILNKIPAPTITEKQKKIIILILGGFVLFTVLFFLVLGPLRKSVSSKKEQWKRIEAQLMDNQAKLKLFSKIDKASVEAELEELQKRLPSRSPVSAVLDELTKRGKELKIDFIAITPQPERAMAQASKASLKYSILPIEIRMRATCMSLCEYLGILENLESTFATVGEFNVRKDEKTFPKLDARVVVYTYILEAERGEK